jgi:4-diphosphocytidyl-2-C-methyl-D-erythritol kinase
MICELAPAKVNLTLEILGKRADGYHEITTIMQTIDICDILTFWENEWIKIIPDYNNLPVKDSLFCCEKFNYLNDNLVYKAASLLKKETGYKGGAVIQLNKNIPSSAGLGGGSSDAAATLKGLNRLWGLNLSTEKLSRIGSKIGSDVPFFIHNGTCIAEGRGEIIKKIESPGQKWIGVILLPIEIIEKTKMLYSMITPENYTNGARTAEMLKAISKTEKIKEKVLSLSGNKFFHNGKDSSGTIYLNTLKPWNIRQDFQDKIYNVFEQVYVCSFSRYRRWLDLLENASGERFHLAGSGPAVFCVTETEEEAKNAIFKTEKFTRFKKYITRTVP